ncbi:MAG: PQQ-binding-like beta-propeller repeat protein [Sphingomonadales bacterium]|nr:PQQ-binding-like beta-propeller repeat protein [Sphingomonadales bacterium]
MKRRPILVLVLVQAALAAARLGAAATSEPIHYQRDQALAGRDVFAAKCASCHGADLLGRAGPPLRGEKFRANWFDGKHKLVDLFTRIQSTMPVGAPASLPLDDYVALSVYLVSQNGYQPTDAPLAPVDFRAVLAPQPSLDPAELEDAADPATPFPQAPKGQGTATTAMVDDADLAAPPDGEWLLYNRTLTGQRFSPLAQITVANAKDLVPQCLFQPGEQGAFQTAPLVRGRTLWFTTLWNTFAIDAATCRKLWEHRYPVDRNPNWAANRGLALYRGKLLRVTPNGHLLALDAQTGKQLWDVWMVSKRKGYWLSAAPVAYKGLVYMGTAGADWGANGFVAAFDVETGRQVWRFDLIPTGKQPGAETWGKGADRGGGSFWSTFAIDAARGQLLVPVGNPAPDFRPELRPGANLFTNSVVALDAATGKLAWYVQQVPHDTHDWDTAAAPMIYRAGNRDMLAVANKGGWLYLYDRATRRLLAQREISPHLNVDVPLNEAGVRHCPGTLGGAEWNGAAFSPAAGALYVNSVHWCSTTQQAPHQSIAGGPYFDGTPAMDPTSEARGYLRAFSAADGAPLWVREFPAPMVAAITPTAGGVLFTGGLDGHFLTLDAMTGRTLYDFDTGGAIAGAPSTYLVDGRQYVAVPSGNSSRTVWMTGGSAMIAIFAVKP